MADPVTTSPVWSSYPVSGTPIAALTPETAARVIATGSASGRVREVHLCNTYTLSEVDRDPRLRSALGRAGVVNLADGAPVAWLGRRHGMTTSVRGPGLVLDVMRLGVAGGLSHYLYGGAPGVADRMREQVEAQIPGLVIAATECPPFRELDDAELAEVGRRITESGADIVWIGLGTPKQDYLVARLAAYTDATLVPVGAAFNFLSGDVPEAPAWMHGSGLEWTYRLLKEPRRLWRRYFVGGPRFVAVAVRHRGRVAPDPGLPVRDPAGPAGPVPVPEPRPVSEVRHAR